ncbi:ATP synthase protein I [Rubricella aquisinus]|uniref:ATP synthase protein I n=1 Tax=Rubricella aquisinus TaxID=2028108 RepID=A0A840X5A5_9RHOB|nr:ATP synthase protein I [Rubricella aquisinus]
MSDTPDPDDLTALDERIEAARRARAPKPAKDTKYNQANMAWHMVIELVVGMTIGLGIGWGLDSLFGTLPLFLMIFGLLGFAAGVKVMLETARDIQARAVARAEQDQAPMGQDKGEG